MPLARYGPVRLAPPDDGFTNDDALLYLTGFVAFPRLERIRCRFDASEPRAEFQGGSGFANLSLRSDDRGAGFLVDAAARLDAGDTLVRSTATVSGYDQGGGAVTVPDALWWLERHTTQVIVRMGSRYYQPQADVDYRVRLQLRSSGGAIWDTTLYLLRCRA
jgi:hypothetical protein